VIWLLLLQHYVARAQGAARVVVRCVYCGSEYCYRMERTAAVPISQFSHITRQKKNAADQVAQEKLKNMLAGGFDPVPCPECGDYQPEMATEMKQSRYRWMLRHQPLFVGLMSVSVMGALFFVCATMADLLLGTVADDSDRLTAVLVSGGLVICIALVGVTSIALWIGMPVVYARYTAAYDPNAHEERDNRLAEARRRALAAANFHQE
jgi:hypothetical protein